LDQTPPSSSSGTHCPCPVVTLARGCLCLGETAVVSRPIVLPCWSFGRPDGVLFEIRSSGRGKIGRGNRGTMVRVSRTQRDPGEDRDRVSPSGSTQPLSKCNVNCKKTTLSSSGNEIDAVMQQDKNSKLFGTHHHKRRPWGNGMVLFTRWETVLAW
jgi:hypothetical protein